MHKWRQGYDIMYVAASKPIVALTQGGPLDEQRGCHLLCATKNLSLLYLGGPWTSNLSVAKRLVVALTQGDLWTGNTSVTFCA